MTAYYNEFDPAAAHILRAMIDADVIAPGDVDTRSIKDVQGGRKARSGKRSNEPLLNGLCFEMEPTGPTPNGSNATTAKRGAPNPVFAFWLMGFPAEWISGALEAMRSFRRPRRKLSEHFSMSKTTVFD